MKRFLIILVLLPLFHSYGQQIPQYSQWSMHQFEGNPAHAGIKRCVDIHTLYRLQWVGFSGAPRSGFLTVSIPLDKKRTKFFAARHGLGFKFETDKIGQFNFNRINAAYAAHFNFDEYKRISFGLYAGIVQMGYDPAGTTTTNPDPSVMNQASQVSPDASFGVWYNDQNYYIGAAFRNLFPSRWDNIGESSRYRFHTALTGGYRWAVGESISLLPAVIVRIPPKGPLSVDLNLHMDYKNIFGIGVGYRNTDAIIGFATIKIKEQFSITYSFDYTLSDIQLGAKNTHEVSLRITTCKTRNRGVASCPLFE
ncbi:MAG: type IX secretion system membrane protein PorP/SprF [Crocinitomicaceae bacterium]|nr:type IX secretion system membrane protein PorP/SprF [Crocinitomicaceae bacterium]